MTKVPKTKPKGRPSAMLNNPAFAKNVGRGRPKGVTNKLTKTVKDMVIGALDDAGGQKYLAEQATKNPVAFMTLLGKVLPTQLTGPGDGPVQIASIRLLGPDDPDPNA